MRNIAAGLLLVILSLALPACGVFESSTEPKVSNCFELAPYVDNTAERDPSDTSNGLVPQTY